MKKLIILTILCLYLLVSCKSVDSSQSYIVSDTVNIKNSYGEVVAGVNTTKELAFYKIGQEVQFKNGEEVRIIIKNIDMNEATFEVMSDDATKEVTLRLVDKYNSVIEFTKKCQTIKRYNINVLPKIKLMPGLPVEQVISTPIFDSECNLIGYQMRYGSQERGCRDDETNSIYRQFMFCVEKDSTILNPENEIEYDDVNNSPKPTTSTKPNPPVKSAEEIKKDKLRKLGFPVK